jgi:UvrD-like helicase C-terminal domain
VVIPVMTQHYAMLQRNLLYTGVTRCKRLVVLVGQKKAVAIAVRNVSGRRRWSKLAEWLRGRFEIGCQAAPSSSSAFASFRSSVSKPSVNQPRGVAVAASSDRDDGNHRRVSAVA